MKSISVQELKQKLDKQEDIQVIDVREADELEICTIGAEHIPMGELAQNPDKISADKEVIIHCRSGGRSGQVIQFLEEKHGFKNLYNLEGGILAWIREIDPSLTAY
ncbi:MAG: rhodanese-like domain-containing protein [Luteibaculum sp.]